MKKSLAKKSFKISGNVVRKNTEYVCDEELAIRLEKEGYLKIIGDVIDKESKKSKAKVQIDSDSDNNLNEEDKNKNENELSSDSESNLEDDDPKENNDIETATLNKKKIKANKKNKE